MWITLSFVQTEIAVMVRRNLGIKRKKFRWIGISCVCFYAWFAVLQLHPAQVTVRISAILPSFRSTPEGLAKDQRSTPQWRVAPSMAQPRVDLGHVRSMEKVSNLFFTTNLRFAMTQRSTLRSKKVHTLATRFQTTQHLNAFFAKALMQKTHPSGNFKRRVRRTQEIR